jgi:hypothetical protein
MNSTRQFDNENLKERSTYLLWLLIAVAGLIVFQFLSPIIRPNRYYGATNRMDIYIFYHHIFDSIFFSS